MLFLEASDPASDWQAVRAGSNASPVVQVFALASHLAFLLPIAFAARYRQVLTLVLTAAAAVVSLAYHTCAITGACFGSTLESLRTDDHVTANFIGIALLSLFFARDEQSARWRRAVLIAPGGGLTEEETAALEAEAVRDDDGEGAPGPSTAYQLQFIRLWLPLVLLAVFFAVRYHPYDVYPVYVTLAMGALAVAVYHIVFRVEPRVPLANGRGHIIWETPVNWLWFGLALGTGITGIVFFFIDYLHPLVHAAWHVLAALALTFAILAVVR